MKAGLALTAMLVLTGCGEGSTRPQLAAPAPPIPVPTSVTPARSTGASLQGQSARALIALFGKPKIDMREGIGRKLQFANPDCVLDVYLYPSGKGREAVATHVDTRLRDGRTADTPSCVAALQRAP